MKRFTKWLVRHRGLVIIICLLLMIPSVLGMAATKTKYDLLYYLPLDLETVQGQEILLEEKRREVETDLELAIRKGRSCGMSNQEIADLFHIILEE